MKQRLSFKRVRNLLMLLALMAAASPAWADDVEVAIGDDATDFDQKVAYRSYHRYSTTQQIYTPAEIGGAGTITALAFKVGNQSTYSGSTVKIYLCHKDGLFTSTSSSVTTGATLVYQGTPTLGSALGWEKIEFNKNSNKFVYNGTDNLVVIVCKSNTTYSLNLKYVYETLTGTDASNYVLIKGTDDKESAATYSSTTDAAYNTSSWRPAIKFWFTPTACAALCNDSKNLYFGFGPVPSVGQTYKGETVNSVWSGTDVTATGELGDMKTFSTSTVPWKDNLTDIEKVVIPAGLTSIGNNAFRGCTKLESVEFADGSGVTAFGTTAFYGCSQLQSIALPATLTTIGASCFYQSGLTEIDIPASVISIAAGVFNGCSALASVTARREESVTTLANKNIFTNCTALKTVYVPTADYKTAVIWKDLTGLTVKTEDGDAGSDMTYALYDNGEMIFKGSGAMTSTPWSGSITSVKAIKLPEGTTEIAASAFAGATNLTTATIPATVTAIGDNAFDGCTALRYLDMTSCSGLLLEDASRDMGTTEALAGVPESTLIYLPAGSAPILDDEANIVAAGTCGSYVISGDVEVPVAFTATSVTYARAMAANDSYTICLPYTPPTKSGVKYYELGSVSGTTLNFTEAVTPAANKPYLVVTTAAVSNFNASDVTVAVTPDDISGDETGGYQLMGTLQQISREEAETLGAYILQDENKWKQVTSATAATVNIPAQRAYLVATAGGGARELDSFGLDGEATTGIENIRTVDANGNEQWFDLSGRRISKPTHGVYIVNGKKVINK